MHLPTPSRRARASAWLVGALLLLIAPGLAPAATIAVDSPADDLALGITGNCTLREAVIAANSDAPVDRCVAGSGPDTITIPAGTYTLRIPRPADECDRCAATADLPRRPQHRPGRHRRRRHGKRVRSQLV